MEDGTGARSPLARAEWVEIWVYTRPGLEARSPLARAEWVEISVNHINKPRNIRLRLRERNKLKISLLTIPNPLHIIIKISLRCITSYNKMMRDQQYKLSRR